MLGAVIGDIACSRHWKEDQIIDIFDENCFITNDSVMIIAVMKGIIEYSEINERGFYKDVNYPSGNMSDHVDEIPKVLNKYMREIGKKHIKNAFGDLLTRWINRPTFEPYAGIKTEALVCFASLSLVANTLDEAINLSYEVTRSMSCNEERLINAEIIAAVFFLIKRGFSKERIWDYVSEKYSVQDLEHCKSIEFMNITRATTQGIKCFIESNSFEDAIRRAMSNGIPNKTIVSIAGGTAGAYYGIPRDIECKALSHINIELRKICEKWIVYEQKNQVKFESLTKYIQMFLNGKKSSLKKDKKSINEILLDFEKEFIRLGFHDENFTKTLRSIGVESDYMSIKKKDVRNLNGSQVLALISAALISSHNNIGIINRYFEGGTINKWLERLSELDNQSTEENIIEVDLMLSGERFPLLYTAIISDEKIEFYKDNFGETLIEKPYYVSTDMTKNRNVLNSIDFNSWQAEYVNTDDKKTKKHEGWEVKVKLSNQTMFISTGYNKYPEQWSLLLRFFKIL